MNHTFGKILFSVLFLLGTALSWAQSGIYVGGHFRRDSTVTVPTLKNSGFTYVILFNVTVETNGDLTMDKALLCSNGEYTFGARHPNYVADVTALRTGMSSVMRVENCIGGWLNKSYDNIKALVKAQGTGEQSILYRNFKALKEAIPAIGAINNDDEQTYDIETATAFHVMLYDLGFKTTIAPYTNKSFWQSLVNNVNGQRPGAIDRIDLQCYDGGAGNNPNDWVLSPDIPMHAGMLHFNSTATIKTQMNYWKENTPIKGGFLWVYNANDFNLKNYAKAITDVFGGGEVVNLNQMKPHVTVYQEKDFAGTGVHFEIGKFSNYAIMAQQINASSVSSIKIREGFKIDLFEQDNQLGDPVSVTENTTDLGIAVPGKNIVSWAVTSNGDQTPAGNIYYLKNKQSGLYLGIEQESNAEGIALVQQEFTGNESQKWRFGHLQNGTYNIINQFSKRSIQARDASEDDQAVLDQAIYRQYANQRNIILKTNDDDVYKIMLQHSTHFMGVEQDNQQQVGARVVQTGNPEDESIYWQLVDVSTALQPVTGKRFDIYPNPVSDRLFISGDINTTIHRVLVTDLQGREILSALNTDNTLDISTLSEGIYFLFIFADGANNPACHKFIKIN